MGYFRFHRSLGIIPGVRVNFSKSGLGLSLGVPGARYSMGPRGRRLTVGIPGTGLSYVSESSHVAPTIDPALLPPSEVTPPPIVIEARRPEAPVAIAALPRAAPAQSPSTSKLVAASIAVVVLTFVVVFSLI
jgi:hypothetical protein